MAVIKLNGENFETEVLQAEGAVLVDFYADWCGPCKMMAPIIDKIAEEISDVKICKLDIDKAVNIAVKYKVMNIPTLIVFKDGEAKETSIGVISKSEIEELINRNR